MHISCGVQVYAHLQLCEKQHGLLVMNGDSEVTHNLPGSWTELQLKQSSQQQTSEQTSEERQTSGQLSTSGPGLADMVCSWAAVQLCNLI